MLCELAILERIEPTHDVVLEVILAAEAHQDIIRLILAALEGEIGQLVCGSGPGHTGIDHFPPALSRPISIEEPLEQFREGLVCLDPIAKREGVPET